MFHVYSEEHCRLVPVVPKLNISLLCQESSAIFIKKQYYRFHAQLIAFFYRGKDSPL